MVIDFTMRLDVFLYFYDLCAHKPENCKLQKELHNMARTHIFKGRDYKKCIDFLLAKSCTEVEKKIGGKTVRTQAGVPLVFLFFFLLLEAGDRRQNHATCHGIEKLQIFSFF